MASQGPIYPGSATTVSSGSESANDWLNATNVAADDGSEAQITAATYDANDISFRIQAFNFGFTIPSGATIDGVVVEIDRRCFAGSARDFRVQLRKTGSATGVGDNKADTVNNWPGTSTVKSYGGAADGWGAGLSQADVNDSTFGVLLSVSATANNTDIGVDFIRVTVHYTEAGGAQQVTLAVTSTFTPAASRALTFRRALAVASTLTTSAQRQISKTLAVASTFAVSARRTIMATLSVASSFGAGMSESYVRLQALAATSTLTPTMTRLIGKPLAVASTFSAALQKQFRITLAAASVFTTAMRKGMAVTLSVASTFSAASAGAITIMRTLASTSTFTSTLAAQFTAGGGAVVRRLLMLLGVGR